jgi:itaconate CoA-transferase
VSLFEALAEWMSQPTYYGHYGGTRPPRVGARHATIAPYGPFTAGDGGTVLLAVQNQREWRRFCEQVLGAQELADDPRFATNPDRVNHREELEALITAAIATLSTADLERRLESAGVPNGRINDVEQLWRHPVLAARQRWREIWAPGGPIGALIPPADLGGYEPVPGDVPALGAHSRQILREIGYSDNAISTLVAEDVCTMGSSPQGSGPPA